MRLSEMVSRVCNSLAERGVEVKRADVREEVRERIDEDTPAFEVFPILDEVVELFID